MTTSATSPILVTGGTGNLGGHVLGLLREARREARVLSRHPRENAPGIRYFEGDTVRGLGLDEALRGVEVVIHLAGGAKGDDVAALNLVRAAEAAGVQHLVLISVIGADRMPIGYFRAKAAAEGHIASGAVPFTILRAAQFHDFVLRTVGSMARMPITPAPGGLRFESVDTHEVAERLVELALGAPAGRVPDLAGPEVLGVEELIRPLAARRGRPARFWRMRMPGTVGKAYRAGDNLAGPQVLRGKRTWAQYLAQA